MTLPLFYKENQVLRLIFTVQSRKWLIITFFGNDYKIQQSYHKIKFF